MHATPREHNRCSRRGTNSDDHDVWLKPNTEFHDAEDSIGSYTKGSERYCGSFAPSSHPFRTQTNLADSPGRKVRFGMPSSTPQDEGSRASSAHLPRGDRSRTNSPEGSESGNRRGDVSPMRLQRELQRALRETHEERASLANEVRAYARQTADTSLIQAESRSLDSMRAEVLQAESRVLSSAQHVFAESRSLEDARGDIRDAERRIAQMARQTQQEHAEVLTHAQSVNHAHSAEGQSLHALRTEVVQAEHQVSDASRRLQIEGASLESARGSIQHSERQIAQMAQKVQNEYAEMLQQKQEFLRMEARAQESLGEMQAEAARALEAVRLQHDTAKSHHAASEGVESQLRSELEAARAELALSSCRQEAGVGISPPVAASSSLTPPLSQLETDGFGRTAETGLPNPLRANQGLGLRQSFSAIRSAEVPPGLAASLLPPAHPTSAAPATQASNPSQTPVGMDALLPQLVHAVTLLSEQKTGLKSDKPKLSCKDAASLKHELDKFKRYMHEMHAPCGSKWIRAARIVAEDRAQEVLKDIIIQSFGSESDYSTCLEQEADNLAWSDLWNLYERRLRVAAGLDPQDEMKDILSEYSVLKLETNTPTALSTFLDEYSRLRTLMIEHSLITSDTAGVARERQDILHKLKSHDVFKYLHDLENKPELVDSFDESLRPRSIVGRCRQWLQSRLPSTNTAKDPKSILDQFAALQDKSRKQQQTIDTQKKQLKTLQSESFQPFGDQGQRWRAARDFNSPQGSKGKESGKSKGSSKGAPKGFPKGSDRHSGKDSGKGAASECPRCHGVHPELQVCANQTASNDPAVRVGELVSSGMKCCYHHPGALKECGGAGHLDRHHRNTPGADPNAPRPWSSKGSASKGSKGKAKGEGKKGDRRLDFSDNHTQPTDTRTHAQRLLDSIAVYNTNVGPSLEASLDFGNCEISDSASEHEPDEDAMDSCSQLLASVRSPTLNSDCGDSVNPCAQASPNERVAPHSTCCTWIRTVPGRQWRTFKLRLYQRVLFLCLAALFGVVVLLASLGLSLHFDPALTASATQHLSKMHQREGFAKLAMPQGYHCRGFVWLGKSTC